MYVGDDDPHVECGADECEFADGDVDVEDQSGVVFWADDDGEGQRRPNGVYRVRSDGWGGVVFDLGDASEQGGSHLYVESGWIGHRHECRVERDAYADAVFVDDDGERTGGDVDVDDEQADRVSVFCVSV